jgi:hypothetical protein
VWLIKFLSFIIDNQISTLSIYLNEEKDIRWKQRLQSYSRAFSLLRVVIEENEDILMLSDLEKEGLTNP